MHDFSASHADFSHTVLGEKYGTGDLQGNFLPGTPEENQQPIPSSLHDRLFNSVLSNRGVDTDAHKMNITELKITPDTIRESDTKLLIRRNSVKFKTDVAFIKNDSIYNLSPLEYGMENVSKNETGYSVKGLNGNSLKISVETDPEKIPNGYTINDVFTYRFDDKNGHWVQLPRTTIDVSSGTITSSADHDGDYINAVIKSPDAPETQGFMPTTMSEIKIADPTAMVQIIQPPVANNQGSANLTYHIETPKGRNGIEPILNVTYNSDGGNSWLGEGWDLTGVSSIKVDTRWGVPTYDANFESETYLLDGQMLAFMDLDHATEPHRNFDANGARKVPRLMDVQFYPRKEKTFEHLVRHWTNADNCYWELTDRKGTKYFYGSVPGSRLAVAGKIAEWKIDSVVDVFGNSMRYEYAHDDYTIIQTFEVSHNIFLKSISYTNSPFTDKPNYNIYFLSSNDIRSDHVINARLGFFTGNRRWLDSIQVVFSVGGVSPTQPEVFRTYKFAADLGAFNRTLLKKITQCGLRGKEFNHHDFSYYNDVASGTMFKEPITITSAPAGLNTGLISIPVVNAILPTQPSLINTSKSNSNTGSFYFGIGPNDWNLVEKSNTVGITGSYTSSSSSGLNTLIDIDGDGLPDKVFSTGISLKYQKNNGHGFENTISDIVYENADFFDENNNTFDIGVQSNFFTCVGISSSSTNSTTSTYFADANGDGLIDIVSGGRIYFNRILNGKPTFLPSSEGTKAEITHGSTMTLISPADIQKEKDYVTDKEVKLAGQNPLNDVVRVWIAPFTDSIHIFADVEQVFIDTTGWLPKAKRDFEKSDGLAASVQVGDGNNVFDAVNFSPNDPVPIKSFSKLTKNIKVDKGTKIYFRVQSSRDFKGNGAFDLVKWNPEIIYINRYDATKKQKDVFNKNRYRYNAAEDFLVSKNKGGRAVPSSGILHVTGDIVKDATNDSVSFVIYRLKDNPADMVKFKNPTDSIFVHQCDSAALSSFRAVRPSTSQTIFVCECAVNDSNCFNVKHPIDSIKVMRKNLKEIIFSETELIKPFTESLNISVPVDSADIIGIQVLSGANMDLSAVQWKPKISLTKGTDTLINEFFIPNFIFSDSLVASAVVSPPLPDTTYLITPFLEFNDTILPSGRLIYTVRDQDSTLSKTILDYKNGVLQGTDTLFKAIRLKPANDSVYATFENPADNSDTSNNDLYKKIKTASYIIHKVQVLEPSIAGNGGGVFRAPKDGRYIFSHHLVFSHPINEKIFYRLGSNPPGFLEYHNSNENLEKEDTILLNSGTSITLYYQYADSNILGGGKRDLTPHDLGGKKADSISSIYGADIWNKWKVQTFGTMFRNWGQFVYSSGDSTTYFTPGQKILETKLETFEKSPYKDMAGPVANNVQQQISARTHSGTVSTSSMDEFNPMKRPFYSMQPFVDQKGNYYWIGADSSVYLKKEMISSSRSGIKDVKLQSPFLDANGQIRKAVPYTSIGIDKISSSSSLSVYGIGLSYASGSSTIETDYLDINGDRFPDIVSDRGIQYTNANGTLGASFSNNNINRQSSNKAFTLNPEGTYARAASIFNSINTKITANATNSSAVNGKNSGDEMNKAKNGIGTSFTANYNTDDAEAIWLDLNGDGLMDKIVNNGGVQVSFNMGNNIFSRPYSLDNKINAIGKGSSIGLSPSLSNLFGVNVGKRSITAGAGVSLSHSMPDFSLQDVNGDGLTDIVRVENNKVVVNLNNGINYSGDFIWKDFQNAGAAIAGFSIPGNIPGISDALTRWNSNFNSSLGQSLGATFTLDIPIPACLLYPCIKLSISEIGYNHGMSIGKTNRQFLDIDGDGFPDLVESDQEDKMVVSYSKIARTNKLSTVTNPLGGKFIIDYKHNSPEAEHPGGKWVMSKLIIDDGIKEDGNNPVDSFVYTGGKYDRYEREFLGFGKVATCNMDGANVYRKHLMVYDTANYYVAGNLTGQWTEDKNEKKLTETETRYNTQKIFPIDGNTGVYKMFDINDTQIRFFDGICFSAPHFIEKGTHEKDNSLFVGTYSLIKYDGLGNVSDFYYDARKPVTEDSFQYHTNIVYKAYDPNSRIFGLPVKVVVDTTSAGGALRNTLVSYNKGKMEMVNRFVGRGHYDTTKFAYNLQGNLVKKTWPQNNATQTVVDTFVYDEQTNIYINKITRNAGPGFLFSSEMKTDQRFGTDTLTSDIHEEKIIHYLDEYGRDTMILGPNESNNSFDTRFTLKLKYPDHFEGAAGLFAITTHYDVDHKNQGIQTINFNDGFGRSIQVKKTAALDDKDVKWTVSGKLHYDIFSRVDSAYQPTTDNDLMGTVLRLEALRDSNAITKTYDELDRERSVKLQDGSPYTITGYAIVGANDIQTSEFQNPKPIGSGKQVKQVYTSGAGLRVQESYNGINTFYFYDPINQLKQVSNYDGEAVFNYEYDFAGRKISVKSPYAGKTTFGYDDAGNIVTKINSLKETVIYNYDYNRLAQVHYLTDSINDINYTYGMDGTSMAAGISAKLQRNRIIYREDASGGESFIYDVLGNIVNDTKTIVSPFDTLNYSFMTKYKYDSWNRIKTISYPDGDEVIYHYNEAGLLDNIIQISPAHGPSILVKHIGYDLFDQRVFLLYDNNITTKYAYDSKRRRLNDIITFRGNDTLTNSHYKYDNLDNIIKNDVANSSVIELAGDTKLNSSYQYNIFNGISSSDNNWDPKGDKNNIENKLALTYNKDLGINTRDFVYADTVEQLSRSVNEIYRYQTHKLSSISRKALRTKKNYKDDDGTIRDLDYNDETTEKYEYDVKGNDTCRHTLEKYGSTTVANTNTRKILWNAENRIKAVLIDGEVSAYIYDGEGNRTIKISSQSAGLYVNGKIAGSSTVPTSFTVYANPYFSMRNSDSIFTKYIYIGAERIASQLEDHQYIINNEGKPGLPRLAVSAVCETLFNGTCKTVSYTDKRKEINDSINNYFKDFDLPFKPLSVNQFVQKQPAKPAVKLSLDTSLRYFYHNSQVNSVNMVSSDSGKILEYVAYLPFGESFVAKSSIYKSDYTFNGKEQDNETGLYYYGARYYDPHTYQWLGVDPMAEKYAGLSAYNFSLGNPLRITDPTGKTPAAVDGQEVIENPADISKGATVYVENNGIGHVYIEVNGSVFSYGRYDGSYSPSSGSLGPIGEGVLLKESDGYAEKRMKSNPTKVYNFPSANADFIYTYLNSKYENGEPAKAENGRVVDTYFLIGNNCATTTSNALQIGGVNIPTIQTPGGFNDYLSPKPPYNSNDLKRIDFGPKY